MTSPIGEREIVCPSVFLIHPAKSLGTICNMEFSIFDIIFDSKDSSKSL
jgi:hypothetical protein